MTDKALDPAAFSKVEFPGVYLAEIKVIGYVQVEVSADDIRAAQAKADDIADTSEETDDVSLDIVMEAKTCNLRQKPSRYRILRDGKPFQVSHLTPGDLPREPDKWGF